MAGALTPLDLDARAELLVDKHARYIQGFAEVRSSIVSIGTCTAQPVSSQKLQPEACSTFASHARDPCRHFDPVRSHLASNYMGSRSTSISRSGRKLEERLC